MEHPTLIIGWKEWVCLPALGIKAICAKTDTGAKTSSIHAHTIEYISKNGMAYVRFSIHPLARTNTIVVTHEAPMIDKRLVKSSNGETEERPVIATQLQLGGHTWPIEINLTNRAFMENRMLLGREALGGVLVQPGMKFMQGKLSERKAKQLYQDPSS